MRLQENPFFLVTSLGYIMSDGSNLTYGDGMEIDDGSMIVAK